MPGLVEPEKLKPADLVGVNKDSYLILEALPDEFDSRVKAMEVDEKPTEEFNDVGGLDSQIQELIEAVVLPMTHKERFDNIGIKPPKGALMYGPPGTGKTLMARACAARTNACFLKLAGPQLVQMFIGDGAKLVRDAFKLAKEKEPAIIFIDELDAVGTKRFDSELSGDREVQRTMLELLNQVSQRHAPCSPPPRLRFVLSSLGPIAAVPVAFLVVAAHSGASHTGLTRTCDTGLTRWPSASSRPLLSHSLTASHPTHPSRSLPRPTASTFSTRRCCALAASTARLSSPSRQRRDAHASCRSIRAR